MIANITSGSENLVIKSLSNLVKSPFQLGQTSYASIEGALQGIKIKDRELRHKVFGMHGLQALKAGRRITRNLDPDTAKVYLNDLEFSYNGHAHRKFLLMCLRCKFSQNTEMISALISVIDLYDDIVHETGHPEHINTSLPAHIYIRMLKAIRLYEKTQKPKDIEIELF